MGKTVSWDLLKNNTGEVDGKGLAMSCWLFMLGTWSSLYYFLYFTYVQNS